MYDIRTHARNPFSDGQLISLFIFVLYIVKSFLSERTYPTSDVRMELSVAR